MSTNNEIHDLIGQLNKPILLEEIIKLLLSSNKTQQVDDDYTGKYCLVRTYSAGVFAGTIEKRAGQEVLLSGARRIWYWAGAASLSQLAIDGSSKPKECKFPEEVGSVLLTEVIEIIPVTPKAARSIRSVPAWKE